MPKTKRQLDLEIADALAQGEKRADAKAHKAPAILMREGKTWRQYLVVTDGRVAIVEMEPAMLGGWKFKTTQIQGERDWPGQTRDQIVAWKRGSDDGKTQFSVDIDPEFRAKLLKRAGL